MREEITEYFKSQGYQVHKIIENSPYVMPEEFINLAMQDIYDEIKNGREIVKINLAREVWRKAYDYDAKEAKSRCKELKITDKFKPIKRLFSNVYHRMSR